MAEDENAESLAPSGSTAEDLVDDKAQLRKSVTSSLVRAQTILEQSGTAAALNTAFDDLDLKKNGRLDRSELQVFLEEAAKRVRLEVEDKIIDLAVEALIEDARQGKEIDKNASMYISREEFNDVFRRHPEMLRVFDDPQALANLRESVRSHQEQLTKEELLEAEKENEQVWAPANWYTHWKNRKTAIVWFIIYFLACAASFTYKAIYYQQNEEAQAVFGTCINVARGCAATLNFNACLVLLPICRHFMTHLRATKLRFIIPFDAGLEAHILFGIAIALFSTAHICAHICDFHRFGLADSDDIYALFGDKLGVVPEGYGARWGLLLKQPAAITGIIMTICLIIAYTMIPLRRKAFNKFWYAHHLLLVMLIALCCHGIGNLLEPFESIYWIIGPFVIYIIPRIFRETRFSKAKVLDISMMEGELSIIRLEKPKLGWGTLKSGMYGVLNIPGVSCVEWHPFTLTSAPHEEHIEFAIKRVGDWTTAAHDLFADTKKEDAFPVVKVEGPIGASSQGFSDFPIVVLIGAGIGATPCLSVLKHLLHYPGKMKRTFFYWTVRDRASFDWFASLLDDIYEHDNKHVLQTRHFLTSAKLDDRDLGAVLLHHATRAKHKTDDFDLLLGRRTHHQVEVGRPDWDEEFRAIRDEAKDLGLDDCGIFLCGPQKMAQAVDESSFRISREDKDFHFYFTKETF